MTKITFMTETKVKRLCPLKIGPDLPNEAACVGTVLAHDLAEEREIVGKIRATANGQPPDLTSPAMKFKELARICKIFLFRQFFGCYSVLAGNILHLVTRQQRADVLLLVTNDF